MIIFRTKVIMDKAKRATKQAYQSFEISRKKHLGSLEDLFGFETWQLTTFQ